MITSNKQTDFRLTGMEGPTSLEQVVAALPPNAPGEDNGNDQAAHYTRPKWFDEWRREGEEKDWMPKGGPLGKAFVDWVLKDVRAPRVKGTGGYVFNDMYVYVFEKLISEHGGALSGASAGDYAMTVEQYKNEQKWSKNLNKWKLITRLTNSKEVLYPTDDESDGPTSAAADDAKPTSTAAADAPLQIAAAAHDDEEEEAPPAVDMALGLESGSAGGAGAGGASALAEEPFTEVGFQTLLVEKATGKIVVPLAELEKTCYRLHIGSIKHRGRNKLQYLVFGSKKSQQEQGKYIGITKIAVEATRPCCRVCILAEESKAQANLKSIKNIFPVHGVWVRHQVDLVDMRHSVSWNRRLRRRCRWILHVRDHGSRFTYLVPLEAKASKLVAIELVHFFRQYGPPAILQSDNGTEFTANALVLKVQKLFKGLRLVRGRPRRPQTQGLVERANRELKTSIRKVLIELDLQPTDWASDEVLDRVMYDLNAIIVDSTKHSPANLAYGRRFRQCLWEGAELDEDAVLVEEKLNQDSRALIGADLLEDLLDEEEEEEDEAEARTQNDEEASFFGPLLGVQPEWDAAEELEIVDGEDAAAEANAGDLDMGGKAGKRDLPNPPPPPPRVSKRSKPSKR